MGLESAPEGRRRIVVIDEEFQSAIPELAPRYEQWELVCGAPGTGEQTDGKVAGLITQFAPVDGALLDQANGVEALLKMGVNYYNVDADEVRRRNLPFGLVHRKGPNCVAELAMTLILALSKDLLVSHQSVAEGAYRLRGLKPERSAQWKMAFHWMRHMGVHEVRGKTLGIIGMGEIGCELARRASVMGMRNLYHKRSPLSTELEHRFDSEYRDLDVLLQESDYICLAVPHTPETERMIGQRELDLMKESAFLINICRGGVIDEEALIGALTERRIAGAGLDVFTYEPLQADSPLCELDNVILTPHIGGGTGSNRVLELGEALDEMTHILSGARPRIPIN